MNLPLVAIVGRPNVGKSTLFNRLTGSRKAIVGDEAVIPANIFKQASQAINEAQAIIWVVDSRAGVTSLDEEISFFLRNVGKPVFIAANKAESKKVKEEASEFYQFGFPLMPISAEHGNSVGDLLDEVFEVLSFEEIFEEKKSDEIKLAIIGRPNVGKSSLLNKILGEERAIVSPIAGTTRDAIDTSLTVDGQKFLLIDTAGIRRKGKTTEMAEKLSVVMAKKSLERADVAILIIDATEGVTNLDANIAGYAVDSGCSVIIAVNKWDAVEEKETNTIYEFEREIRRQIKFLDFSPIITISALTGQRVGKILPLVIRANEARNLRIPTSRLNKFFKENILQPRGGTAPAPVKGGFSRLKVQYITQGGLRPPLFVLFTSGGKGGLHFSYLRYVENRLRDEFGFFATPIRIKEKHKVKAIRS
jgi:GTP-binding protein